MQPPKYAAAAHVSATERDREVRQIIGKRIRDKRLARRWTQQQAADAVGASRRSFQRWEAGDDAPDSSQVIKLARHFDCEPQEFLADGLVTNKRTDKRKVGRSESARRVAELHEHIRKTEQIGELLRINMTTLREMLDQLAKRNGES